MDDKTLRSYRVNSMEEPTDEMLLAIMEKVADAARESTRKAEMRKKEMLSATFPNLRIVGKYAGYYQKSVEGDVIKAIYKACPSLVLVSDGMKDKACWAYKRRNQFSSSIFIYYKEVIGIFSKRVKRIDEKTFERGHEIYHEIIRNPLKIFLIFPYIWYILVLVWYRLLKK